ncbi:substrate-binding periplasmic protein [Curvivirga aplysinae]|uniref:substrate-binding periplasmic protein n=1 Tax=Curvivirga aplysinae TaxID=2529852 RepID=UPI0012BB7B2A|nr:transporter substrate-binding domain-containing protein [Curvivirga aplysinae]MTI10753.1 transporter substrate-binding domain-containing protein [Curvivirga aplysinae]
MIDTHFFWITSFKIIKKSVSSLQLIRVITVFRVETTEVRLFAIRIHNLVSILSFLYFSYTFMSLACAKSDPEIVYIDNSYAPYMYGEVDYPLGLYKDLIQASFNRMESNIKIKAVPWKRAIKEVQKGRAGIAGLYKTKSRLKKHDFSIPIHSEKLFIYTTIKNTFTFNTMEDLRGKNVGLNLGWSYGDKIEFARKTRLFRIFEVRDNKHGLLMLSRGRVEAVFIDRLSATMILSTSIFNDQIISLPTPVTVNPAFLAFSKSSKMRGFLDQFNKTFIELKLEGKIDDIINSYLNQSPSN